MAAYGCICIAGLPRPAEGSITMLGSIVIDLAQKNEYHARYLVRYKLHALHNVHTVCGAVRLPNFERGGTPYCNSYGCPRDRD